MANNKLIPIPGRLHDVSTDGIVSGADEIFDDAKGKRQSVINQDTDARLDNQDNKIDALEKQDVVPVDALPSVSSADPKKIYRVVGETSYTDYMANAAGDGWKELAEFSFPGIDDEPTAGSNNLVESGGVDNRIKIIKELFIDTPFLNKSRFQKLTDSSYTYSENTILRSNGTTNSLNGWYIYTIKNELTPATTYRAILFVNKFAGRSSLADIYANVEIKNASNVLIYRGLIEGYKAILIPNGWTLRFCTNDLSEAYIQNSLTGVYYTTFSIQERIAALESITYDTYPTKGSNMPVKSNGIWERENLIEGLICSNPSIDDTKFDALSDSSYDFEDNKILRTNGNIDALNGNRVYTIANDRTPASAYRGILFVAKFIGRSNLPDIYANVELKDSSNNIIFRTLLDGYKAIIIPNGWTLRYSGKTTSEAYIQKTGVVSDVVLSTSIPFNLATRLSNLENSVDVNKFVVDCVGDSHVQFGNEWIAALRSYLGDNYTVNMAGCGGEGAGTIIGRMNGIPFTVKSDFTIPSTTTAVEIGLTNVYSQFVLPLLAGPWQTFDVEIGGIAGTLSRTTEEAPVYATYYFTRSESGDAVQIKAGEPIYINTTKAYCKNGRNKILWLGENGGYGLNETARYSGNAELASDVDRLVNMIDTYLSICTPTNHLVLTPYSKTSQLLEATFEQHYGSACLNTRKFLINNGIRIGIELGLLDSSIYPTAQDTEDIANGIVPTSLRNSSSDLHLNSIGNTVLFEGMKPILSNLWNV